MGLLVECPKCRYRSGISTIICRCGFQLKKFSRKTYWVEFYDANRQRRRKRIGPQKKLADIALNDVKVKIAKGEYLGVYEEKKPCLRTFQRNIWR